MFHLPANAKPQRSISQQAPKLYRNPIILAREWHQTLGSGEPGTLAAFARRQGISRARVTQVLQLLKLAPDVLAYLVGLGDPLPSRIITERVLRSMVRRPAHEQRQEIGRILEGHQAMRTPI
jgi:hypothetical protein